MTLVDRIANTLPAETAIVVMAMLPVIELRGSIPLGLALGVHPVATFLLSILGNMLLMPAIYYLLDPVTKKLRSWSVLSNAIDAMYERTRAKSAEVKQYGFWGLAIFVGIPLPGTGAVTGVMVASLLRMAFWPTMLSLLIGTIIAGVAVMAICLTGIKLFGL